MCSSRRIAIVPAIMLLWAVEGFAVTAEQFQVAPQEAPDVLDGALASSVIKPSRLSRLREKNAIEEKAQSDFGPDAVVLRGGADHAFIEALRAAMINFPRLSAERARVDARDFGVKTAKASRLPSVSAQATSRDDDQEQSLIRVQQPIYTFGRISAGIDEAKSRYDSQVLVLRAQQRSLIEQVAVLYTGVYYADERRRILDKDVGEHRELYYQVLRRDKGGLASTADTALALSRLSQSKARYQQALRELEQKKLELYKFTQTAIEQYPRLRAEWAELPENDDELIDSIVANDITVRRLKSQAEAARRRAESVKKSAYPSLSLRADRSFGDGFVDRDETRVALVFDMSIEGLGQAVKNRAGEAMQEYYAALDESRATEQEIQTRVEAIALFKNSAEVNIAILKESVRAVESTTQSYLRQYELGRKSWMDVLNMQRELTDQRRQLASAQQEWWEMSLRLATLSGQLDILAGLDFE